MIRLYISIILFCVICFSSCKIPTYAKEKRGQKCELHQLTFHKSLVRITFGKYCQPKTRLSEHGKEFYPNARRQACGGCIVKPYKFVLKYTCSECNLLKLKHTAKRRRELREQFKELGR